MTSRNGAERSENAARLPRGGELSGMRVLVVEDDPSIAIGLRMNLEGEGYDVRVADDGERGLELAESWDPDLIVLDVMLPKMNGLEMLERLRAGGATTSIIILSARTAEMDKVAGLELGAEDYVSKPFSLAELLARIRGALRRRQQLQPVVPRREKIKFSSVEIDLDARSVRRGGAVVEMTATEFDVLVCLATSRSRALTRDEIFRAVWGPNHHGTPRTIDNFMQQLRTKLEPDPQTPVHFLTVRGIGYRFEP